MYFCKQNNKHDGRTGEKRNNIPSHIIYNKGMFRPEESSTS